MSSILNRIGILALVATAACASDPQAQQCANGIFCPEGTVCAAVQQVCLTSSCGNGLVEAQNGEICDDGNITDGDGCAADCRSLEGCGDGTRNSAAGELCDDGNNVNGDGCSSDCHSIEECHNKITDVGEECDDGDMENGDGCDNNCKFTACGNNAKDDTEACDDGNTLDGDGCDSNCTPTGCGNGKVTAPEICDDGNLTNGDGCDSNCKPTGCGNGIKTGIEVCDDGNTADGDHCAHDCASLEVCGNGIRDLGTTPPEVCDDGDTMSGDGCAFNCLSTEICGNGIKDVGEVCDDGNTMGGDNCSPDCQSGLGCGNGTTDPGEECDDGNAVDEDDCRNNCRRVLCGDGIIANQATAGHTEQCDGAMLGGSQATETAACNIDCTDQACGDGKVNQTAGEICDDNNAVDGDGCDTNCKPTSCGNGIKTGTEACDDGNSINDDGCDSNCTLPACGNAIVNTGEACDDGNMVNGDGCDSTCAISGCGNGAVGPGEVCDDGNRNNGDGCDNNCTVSACGNGISAGTEQCDDGNMTNGDGCDNNCKITACGNGIKTGTEACDDGNAVNGDGCDINCKATACGNGIVTSGETCDDGDLDNGDGCDANCKPTGCLNGVVTTGEACDDGNMTNGDGCDNNCTMTGCGNSITTGTEQCDDGNSVQTDNCTNACQTAKCGDTFVKTTPTAEQCDDGNMTTEACPYGQTSCTVCNATCANAAGATSFCGDGTRQMAQEACDDGNPTCGTCNATCQVFASAKATGAINTVDENHLSDGATFVLNDGTHGAMTFEFNESGGVASGNIRIDIAQNINKDSVRDRIITAVNNQGTTLDITASDGGSGKVTLTHDKFTVTGNVAVTEQVSDSGFTVSGMSGGAGGDCSGGQACRADADCASGKCTGNVCVTGVAVAITSGPPDPTNDNTPTIQFSATSPNTPVTTACQVDGGTFNSCTTGFTTTTLADGPHSITVRATDSMSMQATDTTGTFTVDTVNPTIMITMGPGSQTNDTTPTFTFTSADATSFTCEVDAGGQVPCTSPFTTSDLTEAAHMFTVRGTDPAGNIGSAVSNFTVDLTAPVVTVNPPTPNPTNDNTPTLTFSATGSPVSFTCKIDSGSAASCTGGTFTASTLTDGAHTLTVTATDAAGNVGTNAVAFAVDTTAPTVTGITAVPTPTNNNRPDISFTVNGGPATTQCRVDSGTLVNCVSPWTPPAIADGMHTITIIATDAANNTGMGSTNSFTVDTGSPTVTITVPVPSPTKNTTPTVTFTVTGATSTQCAVDMGAFGACTSGTTHTTGTLADGSHTIFVKGSDAAGNSDTKSSTFTVDTVAPTVMLTSQPPANTNDNTATVTFSTGGSPVAIDCQTDGGAFSSCGSSFTTGVLSDAAHSITVRVTDAATNTATATANFTVDTVAPVVNITSGPRFGYPTDENPQTFGFTITGAASSNCKMDMGSTSSCTTTFTSGTLTPGAHTFTITATDAAGNVTTALATNDLDPKVMCLDGSTDRGDATVTGLVNSIDGSTIEFWYRSGMALAAADIVDFDVPSQYPFSMNDSEVRVHFTGTVTGDFQLIISPTMGAASTRTWDPGVLFDPGIWHHYAFVMTGSAQKLFIDGVENMTGSGGTVGLSFTDAFNSITNPIQLHVGVNADTTSTGFTEGGVIDLRVSSVAQYSSSFTVEYPHTVAPGTVLLYPMLEGTGMVSKDEVNPTTHVLTWSDTGWATGCF